MTEQNSNATITMVYNTHSYPPSFFFHYLMVRKKEIRPNSIFCYCKFLVREVKRWETLTSGGSNNVDFISRGFIILLKIFYKVVFKFHRLASKFFNIFFSRTRVKLTFINVNFPKIRNFKISFTSDKFRELCNY